MRLLPSLVLACCALAFGRVAAADTVTLCFERQEVLPWRTLDGRGLNFDLLDEVARRTGVHLVYQSMPWKRCLAQLRANQVDGAFAVSFTPDRLEVGAYPGGAKPDPSRRMHEDYYMLVRPRGSQIDWDGKAFSNVDGKIGFQLGYSVGDFLRAQHAPVDEGSQNADELAQKLIAGRLAAAALGGGDTERIMHGPLGGQLEVLPTPLMEKAYYLILSRALVQRSPQLARRLWDAVEAVRTSPAYERRRRMVLDAARR
jgi:polar amino acid transport system substrate-binding protein